MTKRRQTREPWAADFEPAGQIRRESRWTRALPAGVAAITALLFFGLFSMLRTAVEPGPSEQADIPAPAPARQRIVVLPFKNLGAPQEAYFAAGVTEEITSRLATVSGLGVISSNSAQRYTGSTMGFQEIGIELNVSYVLEGTVRWNRTAEGASRVRVTPRLIRVADDTQVWSERYDRVLEDIFEVQSEIAEQVIHELDVTLFPDERRALRSQPTDNIAAYESYLRGLDYTRRLNYSAADGARALEELARAVELDAGFAVAYARTSEVHSMLYHFGHDRSEKRRVMAKDAVDRALALAPDDPNVYIALGYFHYWVQRDYTTALAQFAVAEKSLPGHPEILEARAYVERRQGLWEDAVGHLLEAVELNPRDDRVTRELAGTLFFLRRYDDADRYYDRAIAFAPDPLSAYQSKTRCLWRAGRLEEARGALEAMPEAGDQLSVRFWYWQEIYEKRYDAALERLASAPQETIQWTVVHLPVSLLEAFAHELRGDPASARQAYDAARLFLEDAVANDPSDARLHDALGHAYGGLGRHDDAVRSGEKAVELLPMSRDQIFGVYRHIELAMILAKAGRLEDAFDEVELALAVPSQLSIALLETDPRWKPLWGHPRWRQLSESPPFEVEDSGG